MVEELNIPCEFPGCCWSTPHLSSAHYGAMVDQLKLHQTCVHRDMEPSLTLPVSTRPCDWDMFVSNWRKSQSRLEAKSEKDKVLTFLKVCGSEMETLMSNVLGPTRVKEMETESQLLEEVKLLHEDWGPRMARLCLNTRMERDKAETEQDFMVRLESIVKECRYIQTCSHCANQVDFSGQIIQDCVSAARKSRYTGVDTEDCRKLRYPSGETDDRKTKYPCGEREIGGKFRYPGGEAEDGRKKHKSVFKAKKCNVRMEKMDVNVMKEYTKVNGKYTKQMFFAEDKDEAGWYLCTVCNDSNIYTTKKGLWQHRTRYCCMEKKDRIKSKKKSRSLSYETIFPHKKTMKLKRRPSLWPKFDGEIQQKDKEEEKPIEDEKMAQITSSKIESFEAVSSILDDIISVISGGIVVNIQTAEGSKKIKCNIDLESPIEKLMEQV